MHKPSQPSLVRWIRGVLRSSQRRMVRYEPAYVLPWVARRGVSTSVLLENNQVEYSRRRRGMSPETTVVVHRHDRQGRTVPQHEYVLKPGNPVLLDVTSDALEMECGYYRMTDTSQCYLQIRGSGFCALTHGRSTTVAYYDGLRGAIAQRIERALLPHRKGLNVLASADTFQTVIVFNLSSACNQIHVDARYDAGAHHVDDLTLPPFGSQLLRFNHERPVDGLLRGHVRLRASAPFELYVLQTRAAHGAELLSIQHVN